MNRKIVMRGEEARREKTQLGSADAEEKSEEKKEPAVWTDEQAFEAVKTYPSWQMNIILLY